MEGEKHCDIDGCTNRWAVLLPSNAMSYKTANAILPDDRDEALLCSRHYRAIRNREGFILGYRFQNGKVRGYVKEWLM